MKYVTATVSFLFVFGGVFLLAGWFLMPHLPPVPERPVSALEAEYWLDNWAGLILGLVFGALSARSVLKGSKPPVLAEVVHERQGTGQQISLHSGGELAEDVSHRANANEVVVTTIGKFRKVSLKAVGTKKCGMYRGRGMLAINDDGIGIEGRHVKSTAARLGIAIVLIVASVIVTMGAVIIGIIPVYLLVEYVFLNRESVFISWPNVRRYAFSPKKRLVAIAFDGPPWTSPVVMRTNDLASIARALRKMAPDKDATSYLQID